MRYCFSEMQEFAYVHTCELYFDLELRDASMHIDAFDDPDDNLAQAQMTCAMICKYMQNPEKLPKIVHPLSNGQMNRFYDLLIQAIKMSM